ncbi:MAG: hypothetical protein HWN68_13900 [Desulfobacterales bacterium]|nr:hypothetical protein [Desulfobacterales bacterium]
MEIVRKLQEGLKVGVGKKGALKTLTEADLIDGATVVCTEEEWNLLGVYTITPQVTVNCGFGRAGIVNEQMGMFYAKLQDATPAEVPGAVRVEILDAENKHRGYIIHNVRTDKVNVDKTDVSTGFKFPLQGIAARPYDKIALFFMPDATATLTTANCDVKMDCTLYG